jgi:hypothetical protein
MAEFFIRKTTEKDQYNPDNEYLRYLEYGLKIILTMEIDIVFSVCESPIEKVFINSLFLCFIKANPLYLIITPPFQNAPKDMTEFRSYHAKFLEFIDWYKRRNVSLSGVDEYLDSEVKKGKMQPEERQYIGQHLILYEYIGLFDCLHLTLQPSFPDLKIDGRSIRPDILVWVPGDKETKIIVECDGFQYHSSKSAFINDRKRDRLLKSEGYEVLRYSGSEIHKDPISTSSDLFEFLKRDWIRKNKVADTFK